MGDRYVPRDEEFRSPRAPRDPAKTVYVGQLRYETSERAVKEWFEKAYGPVAYAKVGGAGWGEGAMPMRRPCGVFAACGVLSGPGVLPGVQRRLVTAGGEARGAAGRRRGVAGHLALARAHGPSPH